MPYLARFLLLPLFALALLPAQALVPKDLPAALNAKVGKLAIGGMRVNGQNTITSLPPALSDKTCILVDRGEGSKAAPAWSFRLEADARVWISVHRRGSVKLPAEWQKSALTLGWKNPNGGDYVDDLYSRVFPKGLVSIPGHDGNDGNGFFGLPHLVILEAPGAAAAPVPQAGPAKAEGAPLVAIKPGAEAATVGLVSTRLSKATTRTAEGLSFTVLPPSLLGLSAVSVKRGDRAKPGAAYSFTVEQDVMVSLFVHDRGKANPGPEWEKTPQTATWTTDGTFTQSDVIYRRRFPKGLVNIPAHGGMDASGVYGLPHFAVIEAAPAR